MNNLPIGIFGGTFDPVHFGHLRAALEVAEHFSLQRVYFVPCQVPVHKFPSIANASDRLAMLTRAIENEEKFYIDDREIRRKTPSYMVETLYSFRKEVGSKVPLALILGMDALFGLTTWYHWEEIFDLAHLIVVSRLTPQLEMPASLEDFLIPRKRAYCETIVDSVAGAVFFQPVTRLDVTSTQVRGLIKCKKNPQYLIPESVWAYIQQHHLYRGNFSV